MERPRIGTMTGATERDDETYLHFVEGVRGMIVETVDTVVAKEADRAVAEWEKEHGRSPNGLKESRAALDPLNVLQSRKRFYRTSQEMFWSKIIETYRKREPELLAELDRADHLGPGSVEYDPNFDVPKAYRRDIHIQPGGYTDEALAGYIYHYGTKVFQRGANDHDERGRGVAGGIEEPQGGVHRALDMGCAIGQTTTALKERWTDAEVWGIDIGMPMVRYAHKRAVDMGCDVHFAQRLAEDTAFPDGYFDLVIAVIMFHEVPINQQEPVVREARRILRPGGRFLVYDFATEMAGEKPLWEVLGYTDSRDNCEPYSFGFIHSDFQGLLRKYFSEVENTSLGAGFNYPQAKRVCTA